MNEIFKMSGDKVIFCDFMSSSYSGQSVKFIYRNHMVTVYDAVGQELYTYATFKEPTSKEVNERVALHQAVMNKSEKVYSLQC